LIQTPIGQNSQLFTQHPALRSLNFITEYVCKTALLTSAVKGNRMTRPLLKPTQHVTRL